MKDNKNQAKSAYDDGNIPKTDLPGGADNAKNCDGIVEPLPESSRPRKDGPGGD